MERDIKRSKLTFKGVLKDILKRCSVDPHNLRNLPQIVTWRRYCNVSLKLFEDKQNGATQVKRKRCKDIQRTAHYPTSSLVCPTCQLQCRTFMSNEAQKTLSDSLYCSGGLPSCVYVLTSDNISTGTPSLECETAKPDGILCHCNHNVERETSSKRYRV